MALTAPCCSLPQGRAIPGCCLAPAPSPLPVMARARLPSTIHFCQVSVRELGLMSLERASLTRFLGSLEG